LVGEFSACVKRLLLESRALRIDPCLELRRHAIDEESFEQLAAEQVHGRGSIAKGEVFLEGDGVAPDCVPDQLNGLAVGADRLRVQGPAKTKQRLAERRPRPYRGA